MAGPSWGVRLRGSIATIFGIGKFRIDVKNHAAEGIEAVTNNLPDLKFRLSDVRHVSNPPYA